MIGRIYLISNDINNKLYVGQTTQSLDRRFANHCCNSSNRGQNMYIKRAILKYGKEHFKIELIEECSIKWLNARETYWIEYFDSYNNGYNLTIGGDNSSRNFTRSLEDTIDIEEFKSFIINNFPTAKQVEKKFKICHSSIYNLIKRLNDDRLKLNPYNPRIGNAKKKEKEVCKKYLEGYNIQDLVKIFHSQKMYISRILKNNGITIQRGRKSILEYNISKSVQTLTGNAEG